jgi:curved DNA-binding protein CbpA
MAKDYYSILDLQRTATPDQIRARFRELARSRHPDRFQGAEKVTADAAFQAITEAFNVLSDAEKRRAHDAELVRPDAPCRARGRPRAARQALPAARHQGLSREELSTTRSTTSTAPRRPSPTTPRPGTIWRWRAASSRGCRSAPSTPSPRAVALDKMNDVYLKMAGKLHAMAGMTAKAEQYYNEALTWGGEDPDIRQALEDLRKGGKKSKPGLFGRASS